jgi:hypothetical protein
VRLERRLGSVLVESDPPGARILANGRPVEGRAPVKLADLPADEPVKIVAMKEGRISKSTVVTPSDGEVKPVMIELPIDQAAVPGGKLSVNTSPAGCAVAIDDRPAGRTPMQGHELRPGPHAVKVACENYAPETRAVTIVPNRSESISFSLSPNVFGYLTINLVPADGTVVEINGQKVQGPVQFKKVVPGRHVVVAQNQALGRKKEETINVRANDRVERTINLLQ